MARLRGPFTSRISSGIFATLLLTARSVWAPRGLDTAGLVAVRDLALTLAMLLLLGALAAAAGSRVLDGLRITGMNSLERLIYGLSLGSGLLAYAILGLGVAMQLTDRAILVLLVTMATVLGPEMLRLTRQIVSWLADARTQWSRASNLTRAVVIIGTPMLVLSLSLALTPPWDYDGLMYHLQGPRLYLEASGIVADSANWYINAPFTVEMLFTIGMAFGDDVLPKLIHFSFGLLFLAAAFAAARRWVDARTAWITVAILLGVPLLPILMGIAYVDLGWSAYEFAALSAVLVWSRSRSRPWLILGGLLTGFALGTKYLALSGFAVLGAYVILLLRRASGRQVWRNSLAFLAPALLVASPWYLKNLVLLGNPVYPFLVGGPGWDDLRLEAYMSFLQSFGTGKTLSDYLFAPIHIYTQNHRFGAFFNSIDVPSILFPVGLLAVLKPRSSAITALLAIAGLRFVLWTLGSQQTRFLLPVFPALAIPAAYFISHISMKTRLGRVAHNTLTSLAVGLIFIPLFYAGALSLSSDGWRQLLGLETRADYLQGNLTGFGLLRNARYLPHGERLLMLGDGRGYYCYPGCIPDPDHFRWAVELGQLQTCIDLRSWLAAQGAAGIFINAEDLDFLLQHDPKGLMREAHLSVTQFLEQGCLILAAEQPKASVYALAPP